GTAVTVTISNQYGQNQQTLQAAQNTVNFLAGRLHSFELGLLKVFVGRPSEIGEICGASEALACYAPNEERMYVPGRTPLDGPVIARLTGPRRANYDLQVRIGGRVVDRTKRKGSRDRVAGTLCAAPSSPPPTALTFVVVRRSGSGPFKLKLTDAG